MKKFKYSKAEGWYFRISIDDITGKEILKIEFTKKNRPGIFKEMQAWVASGNKIEAAETSEEETARLTEEAQQALENQRRACIEELKKTQYIVNGDCDYPQEDRDAEKARRVIIKGIMRGTEIKEIPKRTFPSK